MLRIALVGRPNVGKSTLFNRIAGKKLAIVDDTPGVTRDWRTAEGFLFDQTIEVIDTAGLEDNFDDSIQGRMRTQTESALKQADVIVFIVDGRSGITPLDQHFAAFLRKQKKPVILAVNKAENEKNVQSALAEAYSLGFGGPIALSAEHNIGMEELYHALQPYFEDTEDAVEGDEEEDDNLGAIDALEGVEDYEFEQEDETGKPIKIAIVGRPNVGKSTLLNCILDDQRVMTGPEAGITRDAIAVDWTYNDQPFKLVDTAGIRRKSKVMDTIEKMSVEDSLRAIRLAQIVILVVDGNVMLEKQDIQIAEHVIEEGRALIIAVNKWDSVEDKEEARALLEHKLDISLAQIKNIPFQTISALNGSNIDKLFTRAIKTYGFWNKRVQTSGLNRWLARMESQNPAPLVSGKQNRLKYITQIKTRPPTFALWVSRPKDLPQSHRRFITNGLRRDFKITGVPIRLLVRASKNPYG